MKKLLTATLLLALLLTGCSDPVPAGENDDRNIQAIPQATDETDAADVTIPAQIDTSDIFSDRDLEAGYNESKSIPITLVGRTAQCDDRSVQISGSTVTITDEGVYVLSGALDDGMIVVNAEKTDKLQLVLSGAAIHSQTSAPIYIMQADKVFITLAEDTVNTLSNGGSFTAIDENNIDAVIFSKEDMTLNGSGGLTVTSPGGHGIVSKDSLTVAGGAYVLETASHGLAGKDDVCITGASLHITSGKDGIHAENNEDAALGFVYIKDGTFVIAAEGDGISAAAQMQIDGGTFDIVTGGGSVNGEKQASGGWGGFGGGGRPGGFGGGFSGPMGGNAAEEEEDSTSIKGLKAGGNLSISAGTFTIDSADDAVHSNADVTIGGGSFTIATGDDGLHADETLTVAAGTVSISESYEGLEGLHILVSGGDISLAASDDGLNAAGGTDQSGFGGRGNDMFGGGRGGMGGSSNGSITISGGKLYVNASGDGIDANGTLEITGGYTVVCGPTMGDTATLDYDVSAVISGGTFIGTGASGMAQTFSDSEQGVFAVQIGSAPAGTQITLTDKDGNTVISHAPELSYSVVILSSPDLIKGESYTITVGTVSDTFEAS